MASRINHSLDGRRRRRTVFVQRLMILNAFLSVCLAEWSAVNFTWGSMVGNEGGTIDNFLKALHSFEIK